MRKKEALKIVRKLVTKLKKGNFIEAVYATGSLATDYFDDYSDADLILLVNKKVSKKDIKPLIKNYKIIFSAKDFPYRVDVEIEGLKVMLFCGLYDWIVEERIKKWNKAAMYETEKQIDFIRMKRSLVFFDKRNMLKKFQRKIPEYPMGMREFIMRERLEKLNYHLFLNGGSIGVERKRRNTLEFAPLIADIVSKMYEIVFALNNKYLVDRKWVYHYIKKFKKKPSNFKKRIEEVLKLGNKEKELDRKINILKGISLELYKFVEKEGIKNLPNLEK